MLRKAIFILEKLLESSRSLSISHGSEKFKGMVGEIGGFVGEDLKDLSAKILKICRQRFLRFVGKDLKDLSEKI